MQTKFHVPRSHCFREKCDDNLKLALHFSPILCDRGTWNFSCILTHMNTLCKPNFMFLGHTVLEKNAMITCKNSKLHNCPNKQLWYFTSYHHTFSDTVRPRNLKFFCILTHMDTLCKPNFMFLGGTVFEKNARISCKNSKLHNCINKQLWNFTS